VGRSSGVETARTLGYVCYLSARGLIARQEGYWEWEQALACLADRGGGAPIGD